MTLGDSDTDIESKSVSTDKATINTTGPILEMGVVDHSTINAGDTSTVTVNFQETYSNVPGVLCFAGAVSGGTLPSDIDTVARNVTKSGFEHLVENAGSGVETLTKCGYVVIDDS